MAPVIRAKGLTKRFGDGAEARTPLRELDLEVMPGELCAVVGSSGSGKSTLLSILGGLDTQFQGTLELFGHDVKTLSDTALSTLRGAQVGFVFQSYQLLSHRSVIDNVLLPTLFHHDPARPAETLARTLLEKLGLAGRERDPASALSGGQRQRVALARALIQDPVLLLCDEPTGNLDAETASQIIAVLSTWLEQDAARAIVAITHAPELVRAATQRHRLRDGRLELIDEGAST